MFLAVRHAFLPHERLLTWAEKNVDQSQQTSRSGKCTYWTLRNFTLDLAPEKMRKVSRKVKTLQSNYSVNSQALVLEATLTISLKKITSEVQFAERKSGLLQNNVWKKILPFVLLKGNPVVASPKGQLYKQMTSNPAFTERNIQKANAYLYLLDSRPEQKSLVTYHTLPSLYVHVWLVNTLSSTAPIGSPIICIWSLADICEQRERTLSFGSADVSGAGTCDEPRRTSALEANYQ